jgi:hypothetical protein
MPRSIAAAFVIMIACVMTLAYLRGLHGFGIFAVSAAIGMAGYSVAGWRGTVAASVVVFTVALIA